MIAKAGAPTTVIRNHLLYWDDAVSHRRLLATFVEKEDADIPLRQGSLRGLVWLVT